MVQKIHPQGVIWVPSFRLMWADHKKKLTAFPSTYKEVHALGVSEPVNEKKQPTKSVHKGAKPFKCKLCDYETGLNFNLKKHTEIVHEGLKPFKCKICDFKTGDKTNLKTHIDSVHEGIKPFKCKLCDYKAATNSHLKRHFENIHEVIKPFKCANCDYETAAKSDLFKHIDSVHEGIKPFKCNKCNYETAKKGNLKKHIDSVHEGIKPFKCNICDYKTAEQSKLKTHITVVHEKNKSKNNFMTYEENRVANMSKSAKEIYEASLGISNAFVLNKRKGKNFDELCNDQKVIKVEPSTLKQSQTSDTADPLLIHQIKEETYEENDATPIQDLTAVYVKQEEFDASDYQNDMHQKCPL